MTTKESIRIRKKTIASGNQSLYLDIYRNGKREYEFLKLYLVPEKTRADKEKNRETMKLAEAIKAKRLVELQNKEFGFKNDYAEETRFFDYYESNGWKVGKVPMKDWRAAVRMWARRERKDRTEKTDSFLNIDWGNGE